MICNGNNTGSPRCSVIIPTFNRAQFVTRAIASVFRQSCQDFEIIVIDDGSSDNTREVLREYAGAVTVLSQQNAGVSAARNAGIRKAKGKWIAFLDSDDEWKRDYLSRQLRRADAHPEAVAHITNAVAVSVDGRTKDHFGRNVLRKFGRNGHLIIERPFSMILDHPHWYLQSTIMRRDALFRTGVFNSELTIAEDLDVIARLSLEGPFGMTREILVETYRRPEGIKNLAQQKEDDAIRAFGCFETVYTNLGRMDNLTLRERVLLASVMSANRRALGNVFLKEGKRIQARDWYKKAFACRPSARSALKYLAAFLPPTVSTMFTRK